MKSSTVTSVWVELSNSACVIAKLNMLFGAANICTNRFHSGIAGVRQKTRHLMSFFGKQKKQVFKSLLLFLLWWTQNALNSYFVLVFASNWCLYAKNMIAIKCDERKSLVEFVETKELGTRQNQSIYGFFLLLPNLISEIVTDRSSMLENGSYNKSAQKSLIWLAYSGRFILFV